MVTMVVFTLLDLTGIFSIGNYVYLATLGFVVTLVVAIIASLTAQPKYYGQKGWDRVPNDSNRKNISLGQIEKQILELLRIGHIYMADITDSIGTDSNASGKAIETLDQGGYLMRAGMIGTKFYTFSITEKGLNALKPLPDKEAQMAKEGLTPMYLELLRILTRDLVFRQNLLKNIKLNLCVCPLFHLI